MHIRGIAICLFATIILSSFSLAAEEVLFKKTMTDEKAKHFATRVEEIDVKAVFRKEVFSTKEIDHIKEYYKKWNYDPTLLSAVYVYDDETLQPITLKLIKLVIEPAGTIYERRLPRADLQRYKLETATWNESPPDDATLEEIRELYPKEYWDRVWGLKKVEVVYWGAWDGEFDKDPRFRLTKLKFSNTPEEKEREEEWLAEIKARYALKKSVNGFIQMSTDCKIKGIYNTMLGGKAEIGRVEQLFQNPGGEGTTFASIAVWPGESVPEHEMLRRVVKGQVDPEECKVKKTAFGHILCWEGSTMGISHPPRPVRSAIALWPSGDLLICVSGDNMRLDDLLKLYEDKYPSTLDKSIDIDVEQWHRKEAELALNHMKELVPIAEPTPTDWFSRAFNAFIHTVDYPKYRSGHADLMRIDEKRQLYEELSGWWAANKNELEWSDEAGKLVVTEKKERKKFLGIF